MLIETDFTAEKAEDAIRNRQDTCLGKFATNPKKTKS